MLQPSVRIVEESGALVAEFWDCLRLDPQPVKDLRDHFEAHVRRKGRPDLVVDFFGVGFAGSSALSGFISLRKAVVAAQGKLVLCRLEPAVYDSFRLLRLDPLFRFTDSREGALEALKQAAPPPSPPMGASAQAPPAPVRLRRKPGA
jgi:anti-anti-sigma factor